MTRLNPNDPRPPYVQIADDLREEITSGRLKPGTKLEPGRVIADRYGVAPMTVSNAVSRLRDQGLVISWQGRGVFVRDPHAEPLPTQGDDAAYQEIIRRLNDMYDTIQELGQRLARIEQATPLQTDPPSPSDS